LVIMNYSLISTGSSPNTLYGAALHMSPKKLSEDGQMSMFDEVAPVNTPAAEETVGNIQGKMFLVKINTLTMNPDQPRTHINDDELAELHASISRHGLLQPVVVKKNADGNFLLVAGQRRYLAARMAGLKKIPAIMTDGNPAEIALIENIQRSDLTPIQEGEAFEKLKINGAYTLEQMSTIFHKSRATISEAISLTRLPDEIKNACRGDASIPRRTLVKIARMTGEAEMLQTFRLYRMRGLKKEEIDPEQSNPNSGKTRIGTRYLTSVVQKLSEFDAGTLQKKQRERAMQEVEKIQAALDIIREKLAN
jgi:ParB family transcriptional regulator, chromosome partitioning protein